MSDYADFQVTFFIKYAHILPDITRILLFAQYLKPWEEDRTVYSIYHKTTRTAGIRIWGRGKYIFLLLLGLILRSIDKI